MLLLGGFAFALPGLELWSHETMLIMGYICQKSTAQWVLLTVESLVVSNRADALLGRGRYRNALPFCLPHNKSAKSRIKQNVLVTSDIWCPFEALRTVLGAPLRFKPKELSPDGICCNSALNQTDHTLQLRLAKVLEHPNMQTGTWQRFSKAAKKITCPSPIGL